MVSNVAVRLCALILLNNTFELSCKLMFVSFSCGHMNYQISSVGLRGKKDGFQVCYGMQRHNKRVCGAFWAA